MRVTSKSGVLRAALLVLGTADMLAVDGRPMLRRVLSRQRGNSVSSIADSRVSSEISRSPSSAAHIDHAEWYTLPPLTLGDSSFFSHPVWKLGHASSSDHVPISNEHIESDSVHIDIDEPTTPHSAAPVHPDDKASISHGDAASHASHQTDLEAGSASTSLPQHPRTAAGKALYDKQIAEQRIAFWIYGIM